MRVRDYLLALALALIVVAVALGVEAARSADPGSVSGAGLPVRHAAVAADEVPPPAPQPPPPASVTLRFEAPCGDAAEILEVQREVFGQVPAGGGTVHQEMSVILLVAPSGSWSIVALPGAGELACGVSSGGDWRSK